MENQLLLLQIERKDDSHKNSKKSYDGLEKSFFLNTTFRDIKMGHLSIV
jgi:hypothetical protein